MQRPVLNAALSFVFVTVCCLAINLGIVRADNNVNVTVTGNGNNTQTNVGTSPVAAPTPVPTQSPASIKVKADVKNKSFDLEIIGQVLGVKFLSLLFVAGLAFIVLKFRKKGK